jgi:parallel beta-helix repeat protein
MSLFRIREYPTQQPTESVEGYLKRMRDAVQEEAAARLEDFDILQLANVAWVDVRTYGAKLDGVTDDTTAINAALVDTGYVLIPEGTAIISSALSIPSNTWLSGTGHHSIIKVANSGDCNAIINTDNTGDDNIVVMNLKVDGNGANQSSAGYGIYFDSVTNGKISNCLIKDTYHNGIQIIEGTRTSIIDNEIDGCGTSGSANLSNGIDVRKTSNVTVISRNIVYDSGKNGIRVHQIAGSDPLYATISENICYSNGHIGIAVADSQQVLVNSNVCHSNTNNGLDFNGLNYCEIIGNIAYNNTIHGINPDTCTDVAVNSNVCWNNQRAGIYFVSVDRSTCNSNVCANNGKEGHAAIDDGILLSNSDENVVCGNRCTDTQGTKTQNYGIKEDGTSDYNLYTGNNVKGNVSDIGIDLSGSNSEAHNNLHTASLAIASAATITLKDTGSHFNISGTTNITSVTASWKGRMVTLKFADVLTFTDGSNLKLAGNFTTSADDTITIVCADGTNWYEVSRSAN